MRSKGKMRQIRTKEKKQKKKDNIRLFFFLEEIKLGIIYVFFFKRGLTYDVRS